MSKEAPVRLWLIPTTTGWLHEFDTPYAGADGVEFVRKVDNPDGQLKQLRERQEERRRKCERVVRGTDIPLPPSIPDIDLLLSLYDQLQSQLAQVTQERDRLLRGEFTSEEFQNLCHNMDIQKGFDAFADGCEAYQEKLFGRCRTKGKVL